MPVSVPARQLRQLAHATVATAVAAIALQAAPAHAAPAAPEITGPVGATAPSVELSWRPVAGAVEYDVKVDNDSSFASPEWTVKTSNTVSIPTKLLARGTQHLQVSARDATGTWGSVATSTFEVLTTAGPVLDSPADGVTLQQPADPPLLTWAPVPGAASYTVEVDTEDLFVDATSYATEATALVVPAKQAPHQTYHWRVRANLSDGYATDYSASRSYVVGAIDLPAINGPSNDQDVTDVVLDWDPVPGAKHYELQVDDDFDFSSPETNAVPERILGTNFSPSTTFGNDQYFWRVRARDLDDNPTDWARIEPEVQNSFDRVWRPVPQPVHPFDPEGDLVPVGDDLYFEWTPVSHASHYELWVSTDPNFTEPTTQTVQCLVAGTTFTPGEINAVDQCMPKSEGSVHYWKVRPMDAPYESTGVVGIFSPTQQFVYRDPEAFVVNTPAPNADVQVPVLDWEPVPGTEEYEVTLFRGNGMQVLNRKTHSTSFSPIGVSMTPLDNPYRYTLRALDAAGRTSVIVTIPFTISSDPMDTTTPLVPFPEGAPTYDAPSLRWGAVAGADHYRLEVGNTATGTWFASGTTPIVTEKLPFPAATDLSTLLLRPGTYQWRAKAYDKDGYQIAGPGPLGQFTVLPLDQVTGHRLALTGSSLDAGAACTATLADNGALCDNVPATPVLDWSPVPYASEYRVHVSRDGDFTTGALDPTPPRTPNTRWAPTWTYPFKALQDSQAQTPYHWVIQPCKAADLCGPDPTSTVNPAKHAFRKSSPELELLAPAADAVIDSTEVAFSWKNYFDTNQATPYETGETSYQSARSYQVQVDNESTFATPLDDVTVDQTTYTSASTLYPEGPLWWRVQAIDGNGNALGWTEPRRLVKRTPPPVLASPLAGTSGEVPVVAGAVPFRWAAQPFAGKYRIQVAANGDRSFSAPLRVNAETTRAAFATGSVVNFVTVATLQASDTPYVWRVQRIDPAGNAGPWSEVGEFKVGLTNPEPLAPGAGATVGSQGLVLRWAPVAEAAKYKVDLRPQGQTYGAPVTTPATGWAPTTPLVVGNTYQWRVTSVDVDGRSTDPTSWRTFTVGGVPAATTPVAIDGTGVFDTDLTVVPPVWGVPATTTYQWRRGSTNIEGATGTTYRVRAQDVGAPLTVVATGTSDEFGVGTSTSAAVSGKPAPGPVATTAPVITGSGAVGTTLESTLPTWDLDGTQSARQWMRNGTAIPGATGQAYDVVAADVGAALTLRVTGTLPGHSPTEVLSNAVTGTQGSAPVLVTDPTVSGTPKVGTTLTSTAPTWDLAGVTHTIQWLRDGTPIAGQTASSYTVRAEDVDKGISVRYTANVPGRNPGVVVSEPVTGLQGDAPTATSLPVLTGSRKVGTTLTASAPTWNLSGVTTTVEWLRGGEVIADATTASYVVRPADVDEPLWVRFTGRVAGRADGTATSAAVVGLLGDAPTTPRPAAPSGTRKVGTVLTSATPVWSPAEVEQTLQWLRGGQEIPGETGATYALQPEDVGARISVRYTATAPGRATGTATSLEVIGVEGDAPAAPALTAPTGSGVVGTLLTAPSASWTPTDVQQSRQWLLDGIPVPGETGETYLVRATDAGRRVAVRVSATKVGYRTGSVTSPSVLAAAAPVVTPTPTPTATATATPTTTPTTTPTPVPTQPPAPVGPVAPSVSTTTLKAPKSTKVGTRARVTVTVRATGVAAPTGVVKLFAGSKLVAKVKLAASAKGVAKVRLPKLKKGRHRLRAVYSGATTVAPSSSKKVVLKVTG